MNKRFVRGHWECSDCGTSGDFGEKCECELAEELESRELEALRAAADASAGMWLLDVEENREQVKALSY